MAPMSILDWLFRKKPVDQLTLEELRQEVATFRRLLHKKKSGDPARRAEVMARWKALVEAGEVEDLPRTRSPPRGVPRSKRRSS